MKNVLTRNFVIVPVSLGLLLLPQASVEEPQTHLFLNPCSLPPTSIYSLVHPIPASQLRGRENQRKQLRTPRGPWAGRQVPISGPRLAM